MCCDIVWHLLIVWYPWTASAAFILAGGNSTRCQERAERGARQWDGWIESRLVPWTGPVATEWFFTARVYPFLSFSNDSVWKGIMEIEVHLVSFEAFSCAVSQPLDFHLAEKRWWIQACKIMQRRAHHHPVTAVPNGGGDPLYHPFSPSTACASFRLAGSNSTPGQERAEPGKRQGDGLSPVLRLMRAYWWGLGVRIHRMEKKTQGRMVCQSLLGGWVACGQGKHHQSHYIRAAYSILGTLTGDGRATFSQAGANQARR